MSTAKFIRASELEKLTACQHVDISGEVVEKIFSGINEDAACPTYLPGCPSSQSVYQDREYRASVWSHNALVEGKFRLPDLWSGSLIESSLCFSFHTQVSPSFVPLVYKFSGSIGDFYAVSCDLIGRIDQIYIPSYNLVIYERDLQRNRFLHLGMVQQIDSDHDRRPAREPLVVALVDMTTNFAHQMINHLSGLERYLNTSSKITYEVWVIGNEFFGPAEKLFPELAAVIKRPGTRRQAVEKINDGGLLVCRIGSNIFYESLRSRILQEAQRRYGDDSRKKPFPLIGLTLRAGNRRCLNLPEVVSALYNSLSTQYPNVAFVIDGWNVKESEIQYHSVHSSWLSPANASQIKEEMKQAEECFSHLPSEAVFSNLIGRSALQSASYLREIDFYLSHVGTLQHKLAFFSLKQGVVHGPKMQLSQIQSGAFQAEIGSSPFFLSPDAVRSIRRGDLDTPNDDYEILDTEQIYQAMLRLSRRPIEAPWT